MALTEAEKKHEKKEKPSTKVVIRRLPPTMDKETFLNQVSPLPDYNFIYNVKGDASLGENSFSRCYINFVNPDDVYSFKERFDNYVFVDGKGHEYPAVVEFAPFQKILKKRGKSRIDPKCGTIESDPIYLEFVASLDKPKEQDEKPEYTLQLTNEDKNDVTTPLLEFIKNKRAQRMKIREVRREERKRREFDRRKDRFDERRKPVEEKSPSSSTTFKAQSKNEEKANIDGSSDKREEKIEKSYEKTFYNRNRDKKYEDRKYEDKKYEDRKYDDRRKEIKPRYPKKSYENHDYKEKEYRSKYDECKREDTIAYPKKVKKYSEKREERRLEAQKAEQKKAESTSEPKPKELNKQQPISNQTDKDSESGKSESIKPESFKESGKNESVNTETNKLKVESTTVIEPVDKEQTNKPVKTASKSETKAEGSDKKVKDSESQAQRRIRNKDRPTIAIYRPGMLSRRKQNESADNVEKSPEPSAEGKIDL